MIVLEKTRDISVLKSMGATSGLIRRIFLWEGILIGGIGVILGVSIALILALAQQKFALIYLEGSDLPFPISLQFNDFFTHLLYCLFPLWPGFHLPVLSRRKIGGNRWIEKIRNGQIAIGYWSTV